MEQLVKLYRESHLGKRLPAYDGRKSLYTAGALPFQVKDFKITLIDDDDGSGGPRFLYFLLSYGFFSCTVFHSWGAFLVQSLGFAFWFLSGEKQHFKMPNCMHFFCYPT